MLTYKIFNQWYYHMELSSFHNVSFFTKFHQKGKRKKETEKSPSKYSTVCAQVFYRLNNARPHGWGTWNLCIHAISTMQGAKVHPHVFPCSMKRWEDRVSPHWRGLYCLVSVTILSLMIPWKVRRFNHVIINCGHGDIQEFDLAHLLALLQTANPIDIKLNLSFSYN